jgi:hypothetical protein
MDLGPGQNQQKAGSSFRFWQNADSPTVFKHNRLHYRQPQTGAVAAGSEKRIEYSRMQLLGDPRPVVAKQ